MALEPGGIIAWIIVGLIAGWMTDGKGTSPAIGARASVRRREWGGGQSSGAPQSLSRCSAICWRQASRSRPSSRAWAYS